MLHRKHNTYPNFVPFPNDAKNFEAKHSPAEIPWLLHSTTQDQIHEQQWAPPGPALPLVTALGRGRQWRWKNLTDVVGDQKRQHVSIDMFRNLKWYCWQWSKLAKRVDRNTDILNFTNCKVSYICGEGFQPSTNMLPKLKGTSNRESASWWVPKQWNQGCLKLTHCTSEWNWF